MVAKLGVECLLGGGGEFIFGEAGCSVKPSVFLQKHGKNGKSGSWGGYPHGVSAGM